MMEWSRKNILVLVGIVGGIFLVILLWMFADVIRDTVRAWQKASSSQEVTDARVAAGKAQADADNARALAAETLKDLSDTKQRLMQQIEITKAAEDKLLNSKKISEDTKNDYEEYKKQVLATEYRSTNPALNTDQLCERAKSLGISCE